MPLDTAPAAARDFLEKTGLEPTLNRILVLSALTGGDHALTAKEVYEAVLATHRVNRVTVYRILDLLEEKGIANRVSFGEGVRRYCVGRHHSHFHCTGCDEVLCIDNATLHFDEESVGRALPIQVSSVDLHLEGLCERCRRAAANAE